MATLKVETYIVSSIAASPIDEDYIYLVVFYFLIVSEIWFDMLEWPLAGGALWEECYCTTLKNLGKESMFLSDALLHGLISRIVPDDNLEEEVM